MARRRGKQKGWLCVEGPSWRGYWKSWEPVGDQMAWRTRSVTICPIRNNGRLVTKKEAQRLFDELALTKAETDNLTPGSVISVRDFVVERFMPHVEMTLKTAEHHYGYLFKNHVLPELGSKRLRDVTMEDVQRLIYAKKDRYSPQTLLHVRNAISAMFRLAKRLRCYTGDLPTEGVELPPMRRKEKRALTREQAGALLAALPPFVQDVCKFLLLTGLRIGEAVALSWGKVNILPDWQVIDGTELPPGSILTGSKSEAGNRAVPLSDAAWALLREIRERTPAAGPQDPVFRSATGARFDAHNAAFKHLKPAARALGLDWVSWHALRHTANTWARMRGMSAVTRQRAFGWSVDRMALHYDHASMEEVRAGMQGIAEMLEGGKTRGIVQ